ncbi:MAG: GNVR domain-containing protein [bacterium]|nr:GNVR domain-containing protein [bacterium]
MIDFDFDILANIQRNRFFRSFKENMNLVLTVTIIIFAWTLIYIVAFYSPEYESKAKIWIKDLETKEFISPLNQASNLSSLTNAGNPLLTQMEIIKSEKLLKTVEEAQREAGFKNPDYRKIDITVKQKPNTDILILSAKGKTPDQAQFTLNKILEEYEKTNRAINGKISRTRRIHLTQKINEISQRWEDVREKIKTYQTENSAIDIDQQSQRLVEQKMDTENKIADIQANIRHNQAAVRELQRQLGLNTKDAVNAVAIGSGNKVLEQLRQDLNRETQILEYDLVKFSDTNPKIIAQRAKINTLKTQIMAQISMSVGQNSNANRAIFDTVREDLVDTLAQKQAQLLGYQAQERALRKTLKKVNADQTKIPDMKYNLSYLEEEEAVLAKAYAELRQKLIETKLKESEAISNVIIVDMPDFPKKQSFPTRMQFLLLGLIFGFMLGTFLVFLKTLVENICDNIYDIEEITGEPIIGAIPWINNLISETQKDTICKIAEENIISHLKLKCLHQNKKVLTFSSSSLKKYHSNILQFITHRFNTLGYSVMFLDCDFRNPTMYKNFSKDIEIKKEFSDLILSVGRQLRVNPNANIDQEVLESISTCEHGVHFLMNTTNILEPYEFFGTPAFKAIIEVLKRHFDCVFIDVGPVLITPEFIVISKLVDGVVLLLHKTVTYSALRRIMKLIKDHKIEFVGSIVRESSSKIESEYEEFLKHIENKLVKDIEDGSKEIRGIIIEEDEKNEAG